MARGAALSPAGRLYGLGVLTFRVTSGPAATSQLAGAAQRRGGGRGEGCSNCQGREGVCVSVCVTATGGATLGDVMTR